MSPQTTDYSPLERALLNNFQQGFPLSPRPYAELAAQLGVSEQEVMTTLKALQENKTISRVGPVFRVGGVGASTLAAMAVPPARLEEVAAIVSEYEAVNHNYEREHDFNLWFVATATDEHALQATLDAIEQRTGLAVMYLPMLEDYHIDLGFDLLWT
ncbi:MAG: Lrp/AsnC family transcriptional regulator [Gammaproteobacteria bacterium]|nr:Lrp/AsnC family transcriptional regulator [Gammaproteobacteria bacterium]